MNPVVTSKGKLPKAVDNRFLQGTFKEDREGFSRTRRPGRGHLGHSGGWQDTEGNHTHSTIHLPIKQKSQSRGLEGYGSSSSAPPTPQRSFPMEYGQQEIQHRITLGRTWVKLPGDILQRTYENHQRMEYHKEAQTSGGEGNKDKRESSHYPSYRRTAEPDRDYLDYFSPQAVDQPNSPVPSHHPGTSRSVAKSYHSSQSQVVSGRRPG
ncbi:hypothetical protein O181_001365 [Austropuccinia psidii MF-1]|uniref:Uncharacterized protein n=1 Tax=Austropuccinia psidii MF-1 TaxID=1389203 RepID=A0A9Q3GBR9_9BASI|nr:hypothetical protein [Austropuccinia psidii MF-1]